MAWSSPWMDSGRDLQEWQPEGGQSVQAQFQATNEMFEEGLSFHHIVPPILLPKHWLQFLILEAQQFQEMVKMKT